MSQEAWGVDMCFRAVLTNPSSILLGPFIASRGYLVPLSGCPRDSAACIWLGYLPTRWRHTVENKIDPPLQFDLDCSGDTISSFERTW
jgi:hypothetical protein